MMGNITMRSMVIGDYQQVINLWEKTPGIGLSNADSREELSKFLEKNKGLSYVCEENNEIIATIVCGQDGRRGYIYHLAVNKDYRLKGLGRKMVDECLIKLKELGIDKCHLFVFEDNDVGRKFWDRIGWTQREEIIIFSKYT